MIHSMVRIGFLVLSASCAFATAPVGNDQSWIDLVVPRLQSGRGGPGSTSFDQVAESLQRLYSSWGIGEWSLRHQPQVSRKRITMSDGTRLFTVVVNPWPYHKRKGTTLVRSPYGSKSTQNIALVFLALNGFAAVMQEDRGFFRSDGVFDMWRGAGQDGKDTIDWITRQSWSNGKVYSVGGSADGIAAVEEILTQPKAMKGEWLIWTTANGRGFIYPGGAFRQNLMEGYMDYQAGPSRNASLNYVLPAVERHEAFGPWWYNITACPNVSTNAGAPSCRYNYVHWPLVMNVGWWDIFQRTNLEAWNGVRSFSAPAVREHHVLFVGPLGHCIAGNPGTAEPETLELQAQEAFGLVTAARVASEFFAGNTNGPVRQRFRRLNLFVMGAFDRLPGFITGNFWTSIDEWPAFTPTSLYFTMAQKLTHWPAILPGVIGFMYDPNDPAPMVGGNNLPDLPGPAGLEKCGSADLAIRENRSDVLVFDSRALPKDVAVVGPIKARLFVSSSAPDTDFVVTLSDLTPRGQSMLVRFGVQRMRWRESETHQSPPLQAGKVYKIDVQLDSTAYIFPKGHKVRVTISSAAAPYFNPTSNTGVNDMIVDVTPIVASNAIHVGVEHPSQIVLPVVSMDQIPRNPSLRRNLTWGHSDQLESKSSVSLFV